MDELLAVAELSDWSLDRRSLHVTQNVDHGLLRLQTFDRDPEAVARLGVQLNQSLPGPGESLSTATMTWFWAGPGHWVIAVEAGREAEAAEQLQQQAEGLLAVVHVISDSRVTLELTGEAIESLLSRGSTVDFAPHKFTPGRCLTTLFAGLTVMLARSADGERVLMFVDRSLATYLTRWIEAASVDC